MNAILFGSMLLMLLLAMTFATAPLIRSAKSVSNGFANVPLLVALAALLLAIGLYAAIGRPDVASSESVRLASPGPGTQASASSNKTTAASVTELLAGLEQRLDENPDDAKGWLLLAKSYEHLDRHGDAAAAYDRARELGLSDSVPEARRE